MHWAELRTIALGLTSHRALSETEQDLVVWMVALLDRIGPQDLETDAV